MARDFVLHTQTLLPLLLLLISPSPWLVAAFTGSRVVSHNGILPSSTKRQRNGVSLRAGLRKDVEIPLLDVIDRTMDSGSGDDKGKDGEGTPFVVPLPSSDFPDPLVTPFLYGMQLETPLHKIIVEEAVSLAEKATVSSAGLPVSALPKPFFGHLVWKDGASDSLVGAIGCTAEILVNAPLTAFPGMGAPAKTPLEEQMDKLEQSFSASSGEGGATESSNKESSNPAADQTPTSNMVLCRGGWRFVVKEVIRTIPYPVAIVDEIEDDANEDDSDMFSTVGANEDDGDDEEEDDEFLNMEAPELIHNTMRYVQSIVKQKLEEATAKTKMSPLEQSILEDSEMGKQQQGRGNVINPAAIELAHAEEMAAVWDVFQISLIDDIEPSQRRFAVAIMAAELASVTNDLRKELLLVRNSNERLRIVLRQLKEIVGMATARKMASAITESTDETEKDLKVGQPQLPPWARQITKGTKIEYFWNEEYEWCPGVVVEDPLAIGDELLLTIRFDEDGEEHRLPLNADEKLRWRPAK